MSKLLEFSTGTTLDAKRAKLEVEVESLEKQTKEVQIVPSRATGASTTQMTRKNTTLSKVIRKQSRFAVISTQLLHTNLAILHYTGWLDLSVLPPGKLSCSSIYITRNQTCSTGTNEQKTFSVMFDT